MYSFGSLIQHQAEARSLIAHRLKERTEETSIAITMRASIATSLLAVTSVNAFTDSSPFLLFSTAEFPTPDDAQLQSTARVLASAKDILSSCSTSRYLLVSQPTVHATDLRGAGGCQVPSLCRAVEGSDVKGRYSVAEILGGDLAFDDFSKHIRASCQSKGRIANIEERVLPALPSRQPKRAEVLADNDLELAGLFDATQKDGDYTIIYFSNPHEAKSYEAEFADGSRVELKREIGTFMEGRQQRGNQTDPRPLFEKYQFFTPGIFMGLLAFFTILTIMYVGLSALGSLKVPYGAFEKDMGPAAQKKQQ